MEIEVSESSDSTPCIGLMMKNTCHGQEHHTTEVQFPWKSETLPHSLKSLLIHIGKIHRKAGVVVY